MNVILKVKEFFIVTVLTQTVCVLLFWKESPSLPVIDSGCLDAGATTGNDPPIRARPPRSTHCPLIGPREVSDVATVNWSTSR